MTLLKIRLWLVSVDLIYFNSSYSLEVKRYIQGESSFLGTYLSFVKIKLILYFYITLHIEPEDPVECKYSRFHSSLQVEEYFCFTRYSLTSRHLPRSSPITINQSINLPRTVNRQPGFRATIS